MTSRLLRFFGAMTFVLGVVTLGGSPTANASLTVTLTQTAGPSGPKASIPLSGVNSVSFNGDYGDFNSPVLGQNGLDVSITANSPGQPNPTGGFASNQTTSVRNNSAGLATLVIEIISSGYVLPVGNPLDVLTTLSVNSFIAGSGTGTSGVTFFSELISPPDSTPSDPLTLSGLGFVSNLTSAPRTGPYSLRTLLTISLRRGGSVTVNGTVTTSGADVQAVPEPATMAMLLPSIAFGAVMIRRKRLRKASE